MDVFIWHQRSKYDTYKILATVSWQFHVGSKKDENDMKCCGGLLSPDAQKLLAKFDLCLPTEVLADPQIF